MESQQDGPADKGTCHQDWSPQTCHATHAHTYTANTKELIEKNTKRIKE